MASWCYFFTGLNLGLGIMDYGTGWGTFSLVLAGIMFTVATFVND